jgi:hypothetical protein
VTIPVAGHKWPAVMMRRLKVRAEEDRGTTLVMRFEPAE